MLLRTWVYKRLFQSVVSIFLGTSSEVELLDHVDLRFLPACEGENVDILKYEEVSLTYTWFSWNFV